MDTELDQLEQFFIVTPPGFEELSAFELEAKMGRLENVSMEVGGLNVSCPLLKGLQFNQQLKIPVLVLLRIAEFKCRDLPKLFQKVSNIKWGRFLLNGDFELKVNCRKSRLLNEKKVEKTIQEGIARHFQKQPHKKLPTQFTFEIHVRFFEDICTISLNTSGDHLFKRGYKELNAVAPLRENLAAGLAFAIHRVAPKTVTLVDPMCGTGTLLLEALQFGKPSSQRQFAFQNWKKEVPVEKLNSQLKLFENYFGFDRNEEIIKTARVNLNQVPEGQVAFSVENNSSFAALGKVPRPFSVVCNPPYNKRIKLSSPANQYYEDLIHKILSHQPEALGLIVPQEYVKFVPKEVPHYNLGDSISFANGGIPVRFVVYEKHPNNDLKS